MAEEVHGIAPTRFPDGIPCWGVPAPARPQPGLRYAQDAHGRYLVTDAGVLAVLVGADGLEAQRLGVELAAAPLALDAVGWALDDLDTLAGALAGLGMRCELLGEIRATLTAALSTAGRPTERYHSRPGGAANTPRRG